MSAAVPMLRLDGIEVRYGGVAAVRELELEVGRGEIVGLIGPNGAGKSTTLHAIMGLVPLHRGDVRLAGASLRGRRPEAIARAGVSLVPEGRRIYAGLTVEENLRLGLAARRDRASRAAIEHVSTTCSPWCGSTGAGAPAALSGGQQQQLAIGRALVGGTRRAPARRAVARAGAQDRRRRLRGARRDPRRRD